MSLAGFTGLKGTQDKYHRSPSPILFVRAVFPFPSDRREEQDIRLGWEKIDGCLVMVGVLGC